MDGVLVVDKPAGMTSHDVVDAVRRATRRHWQQSADEVAGGQPKKKPKVGHAGTLDPDATGVLVVCLGRATRLVPYLQASRKTYEARIRLGQVTSTLDAAGEVIEEDDAGQVDEASFCEALTSFVGDISQLPPMVSAVKVGGERLHAKARRGEEVERETRTVTVHDLVLEEFVPGPHAEASVLVTCSPGTYVRALAADVGARLEVGAHLVGLRRLGSGRFSLEQAVDLEKVSELAEAGRLHEGLLALADAVADYPVRHLDEEQARAVGHGKTLPPSELDGPVAAVDARGRLVAMMEDREGSARPLAVLSPAGG